MARLPKQPGAAERFASAVRNTVARAFGPAPITGLGMIVAGVVVTISGGEYDGRRGLVRSVIGGTAKVIVGGRETYHAVASLQLLKPGDFGAPTP